MPHQVFKKLREVRSLAKIMTTIISKARSVKYTIKWWLRTEYERRRKDTLYKIINEVKL